MPGRRPALVLGVLAALLPAAAPPPASALVHCTATTAWGAVDRDAAREVLRLVNEHRAGLGLEPLALDGDLQRAAEWKSLHMARYGYFSHDDPAPPVARDAFERFADCGYADRGARGENIAAGQPTPASVMASWLASKGHRENIERAAFRVIGIGVARRDGSRYGIYWTQTFGDRSVPVELPPPPGDPPPPVDPPPDDPPPGDPPGTGANRPPVAAADRASVRRGRVVRIRVLRNDRDPDGDRVRLAGLVGATARGRARTLRGVVVYRAPRRGTGVVRVRYAIVDGRGGRATGLVRIRIR